ncbi:MAG: FdtA/QdtA family cupin domain-containing protein [Pseudomonadota bacterium]|nr:FdtA/QdtA family cupin domain-containing protein [Pseudomonadota bacterium]
MTIPESQARIIDLRVIADPRGDLTVIEGEQDIPFSIARVYYLYNVPVSAERGGHAHKDLQQVIFALSGSFRIKLDNGTTKAEYWLRNPRQGLYVDRHIWREIDSFSQGAVSMVLASQHYDEQDYFRDYDKFIEFVRTTS